MVKLFLLVLLCSSILCATHAGWIRKVATFNMKKVSVALISLPLLLGPIDAVQAVSGGGKDYATKDIRGMNFNDQNLATKDFTQADATGATFKNAKLKGSRFYRANLKEADFTGADLSGASLEDTSLQEVDFTNALLEGAYFSASVIDVKSIAGADFTDALMPEFAKSKLCARADVHTGNAVTGVVTSDSLFCP